MKKILQKSLYRLHSLLLLAVMFVVGGSAWAQITFDLSKGTQTKDGVTVTAPNYDGSKGVELWGGTSSSNYTLTISSPETPIERVEFSGVVKYGNGYTIDMDSSEGGFEGATTGSSINWVKTESVNSIVFTANKTGDYNTRNNIDFYVKTAVVYLEEAGNYVDFNYSSANGGEKGFYSLSSDALTFDAPVTVEKNLKIDGSNVTSAAANGNVLNVNFSEINTPGIHTLTVPKGALRIGEDLNNEFSVTYTLVQDPNKLNAGFNFNGDAIPYTTGGNPSTLTSGKNLAVGDVFESNGVTMTFTATSLAWSNSAQRLRLGQNTAFTIAAPEGYEITNVVFKTDANNIQLSWIKGLDTSSYTQVTWTGNEESLDFRVSYDTWIQTIDVTCVKLSDVEYEVDIYKGTEPADDDWTVTVNGVDGTFKNTDTFTTGKNIQPTDVVAPHHDGYHEAEVEIEEMAGTMFITVTYTVFDPINYTIDFSDNAPAGASVTIDGQEFSGDDTYPVAKDLDYFSVTAVDAPAGWYADYDYNETNHTFTFDFKQYINYSVVVEGAPAGQGGVVYDGNTYGAGENVINAKTALTESGVSVADVAGYAGTVSLDDHTFTVSYKKETIVVVPVGSTFNSVVGGITFKAQQENNEVNLYSNGTGYLDLSTTDLNMVKIQLVCNYSNYTATSGDQQANLYNLGQYVYVLESEDMGSITSSGQNVEWTGSTKHIRFTAPYDFHVTSIKVWVEEAEVEPRSNVMDVASTYFSTGNVEQIDYNLTFVADVNTEGEHSGAYGSSTEVPDGVTLVDGNSVSYTISSMQWWDNGTQVVFNLPAAITTPGDYTLTIPEGVIPCVGNKANKELTFTWHVLTPAPAFPLQTVAYEVKSVADDKFVTLTNEGLALDEVSEGFTFTWSRDDEAFIVKDKDENRLGGDTEFWTVESLGGEQYAFVSKSAGTYIGVDSETVVLDANAAYAFTLAEYIDPALFGAPASALALDESGFYIGTYYADYAWTTDEDVFVCVVIGIGANNQLQTQMVNGVVPANTGVLLYTHEANDNIVIKKSTEQVDPIEGNLLDGTVEATDGVGGDGATYYLLSKKSGRLGFYWDPRTADEGATLNNGAHKAYLRIPAASESNKAAAYFFDFGEGTLTGIDAVSVDANDAIFNLQGKRVSRENLPAGVYVKDGKKFIVK